jgi:cell division protein FtsL
MKDIILIGENNQFQEKNHKLSLSLFLFIVILISLLVIFYICTNIVLMKLGYQSIELEQRKEQLLAENDQLEYSVECLSSLTRIEKIASEGLGMKRPEKIEFIAMLPARINTNSVVAEQSSNEAEERTYLQAGNFPREFANLPIFKNQ